jgi:hypothetical protein
MSFVRVWSNMNSRIGASARLSATSWVIWPFWRGSNASFLISPNVGAITKIVRKSAMPTSTWLGGAVGVPRPVRMKPRTMMMRVKPVSVNSAAGISDSAPIISSSWTALAPSVFT